MSRSGDGPPTLPAAAPVRCTGDDNKDVNLVPHFKKTEPGKEEFGWIPVPAEREDLTRKMLEHYSRASYMHARQNSPLSRDIPTQVAARTGVVVPAGQVPATGPVGPIQGPDPLRDAPGAITYTRGQQMRRGDEVKAIQERITAAGIRPGVVIGPNGRRGQCQDSHMTDGIFGPCTADAVARFQRHYATIHNPDHTNPLIANGQYDQRTHEALANLSEEQLAKIREAARTPGRQPPPPQRVPPQRVPPQRVPPERVPPRTRPGTDPVLSPEDFSRTPERQCGRGTNEPCTTTNAWSTVYHPKAALRGESSRTVEGPDNDRLGKPLCSMEQFARRECGAVTIAIDQRLQVGYNTPVISPQLNQRFQEHCQRSGLNCPENLVFAVRDTGACRYFRGPQHIDITTETTETCGLSRAVYSQRVRQGNPPSCWGSVMNGGGRFQLIYPQGMPRQSNLRNTCG